ncbi:AI-2E family transporter [Cupriavidus sp. H39]|uniref:AI-2E family transporter n=1 Tax=Cupriavidus sp. H39 TaxID=3401635 RepID=UPI003D065629
MMPTPTSERVLSRGLLDVLIRAGLIAVLAIFCFQIFRPFLDLIVWSVILAVTIYPLQVRLRRRLGNRDGRAATLIVLVAIAIIALPAYLLGDAMLDSLGNAMAMVKEEGMHIPPPAESVASWPLVGQRLYDVWLQAASDLTGVIQAHAPQVKEISLVVLGAAAGIGKGLLIFVFALIIGGIFMAYGEAGNRSAVQIAARIFGPERGQRVASLCTATIRAVAQGVVGIAFIQMLLIGVAFVIKGVPAAGVLAMAVLLLGIAQLPATLITVPVIIFVFANEGASMATIIFAVYVFVAGLADNVLKPLLLGRGVDVPMPVVLIGALGGMVTGGVIGLFIGPVMLAVGYQLFWQWVEDPPLPPAQTEPGNQQQT